jgi:hypothetical protein
MGELVEQPRLAHAGLADQGDDLALAGRGQLARPLEGRQLALAADEGREAPAGRRLEARARRTDARQIERLDWLREPFTGTGPSGRRSMNPSASRAVAAVSLIVPGLASCSIRLARCTVGPIAS